MKKDSKVIFRRSKEWSTFRNKIKKKQKIDPVTGNPLVKGFNLHHRDFNPANYEDISDENKFVGLNQQTHECLHFVYGSGEHRKDWKAILKRLAEQCEIMDLYNDNSSRFKK